MTYVITKTFEQWLHVYKKWYAKKIRKNVIMWVFINTLSAFHSQYISSQNVTLILAVYEYNPSIESIWLFAQIIYLEYCCILHKTVSLSTNKRVHPVPGIWAHLIKETFLRVFYRFCGFLQISQVDLQVSPVENKYSGDNPGQLYHNYVCCCHGSSCSQLPW